MKLKCIGGPMNGQFWHVEECLRHGDIVRARELPKISTTQIWLSDIENIIETTSHEYFLDALYYMNEGNKETVKFLRYNGLSHWQAIKQQFE